VAREMMSKSLLSWEVFHFLFLGDAVVAVEFGETPIGDERERVPAKVIFLCL